MALFDEAIASICHSHANLCPIMCTDNVRSHMSTCKHTIYSYKHAYTFKCAEAQPAKHSEL